MPVKRRQFLTSAGIVAGISTVGIATNPKGEALQMLTEGGGYYFGPGTLYGEPRTTVTFKTARGSHNSVSYPDRIPSRTAEWLMPVNQTAEHTSEEPSNYDYYHQPHRTLGRPVGAGHCGAITSATPVYWRTPEMNAYASAVRPKRSGTVWNDHVQYS